MGETEEPDLAAVFTAVIVAVVFFFAEGGLSVLAIGSAQGAVEAVVAAQFRFGMGAIAGGIYHGTGLDATVKTGLSGGIIGQQIWAIMILMEMETG